MANDQHMHEVFEEYSACTNREQLEKFIEAIPEALDPDFHRYITGYQQHIYSKKDILWGRW